MPEITDQQIEQLPNKKIREAFESCTGDVQFCPECDTLTAFTAPMGIGGLSRCHNCSHTESL